jgi:hypothetical protein
MHGVSLFNFGDSDSRWGWYASFRANSSFFEAQPTQPISAFAFNAGAILKLFKPVSLYFGPGIGNNSHRYDSYSWNDGEWKTKTDSEWFFNPEMGIALNFHYFTLFGGLKYPLPKNDQYEKILYSAGAGINISGYYDDLEDDHTFLSYMIDIPVSATSTNPPGFIGLAGGIINEIGGGYLSFRGNTLMFGGGGYDDESTRAHIALTGGGLIRTFYPIYLSLGIGAYWEWSKQSEQSSFGIFHWRKKTAYLMPEIGLHILCYNRVLLSFGRAFPGFRNDKVIYTAGIGLVLE